MPFFIIRDKTSCFLFVKKVGPKNFFSQETFCKKFPEPFKNFNKSFLSLEFVCAFMCHSERSLPEIPPSRCSVLLCSSTSLRSAHLTRADAVEPVGRGEAEGSPLRLNIICAVPELM